MEKLQLKYDTNACPVSHCVECGSINVSFDDSRGEVICDECGLVIEEHMIDRGPEWRSYTTEERNKRCRVGSPVNYAIHDKGLSTTLGYENRDAKGRLFTPRRRTEIYRLRKWQRRLRIRNCRERTLVQALGELDRLSSQLDVPRSTKEEAAIIYHKAWGTKMGRGISVEVVVAAVLYAACRIRKNPRTLDEIAIKARISKKMLGQWFRRLIKMIDLSIPLSTPLDFISRFSNELKLSEKVSRTAIEILGNAKEEGITTGKTPTGLAAAALYIAGELEDERRTKREIAKVGQITEVTVRNRCKDLVENLEIDFEA
jgi:transcription initiation factor TFIIB